VRRRGERGFLLAIHNLSHTHNELFLNDLYSFHAYNKCEIFATREREKLKK
jgi:hypothetical protein